MPRDMMSLAHVAIMIVSMVMLLMTSFGVVQAETRPLSSVSLSDNVIIIIHVSQPFPW